MSENSEPSELYDAAKGKIRFVTNKVLFLILIGVLLLVLGQTDYVRNVSVALHWDREALTSVLKTIGATLLGSGVFTAIIKSSEYSDIFKKVIGDVIWSKDYIKDRKDKRILWSLVSRAIYEEKFPDISDELENLITENYFPTLYHYYAEDYQYTVNICDKSDDFAEHIETIRMVVRPTDEKKFSYKISTLVDLPFDKAIEDLTVTEVLEIRVDGESRSLEDLPQPTKDDKYVRHTFSVPLEGKKRYELTIKRRKVLCKLTNPDKRIFALTIIKNMTVTAYISGKQDLTLHKMGTINDYEEIPSERNKDVTIKKWEYKGIILPKQGFIGLFK